MTWGKVAPPDALVELSEIVSEADGPLPPARVLPLLRQLADQIGEGPADAFGFATVAYHALTGIDPFAEGPDRARPVTDALPGFPDAAGDALMLALSPDRSARPAPGAMVAALDAAWPAYDEPATEEPDRAADDADDEEPHVAEAPRPQSPQGPQTKAEFQQAMRDLVSPPRAVPELGTVGEGEALPEAIFDPERPNRDRRRRRSGRRRRRPSSGR
ncbi:hypothetical protein [Nocardioides panacisoli]|uniref:DUF4259 domain-containing protein n=1 Tax=Nocardioides panacisoli TaxID=627624 RepID=A0ABP7IBA9_9ACTN